MRDRSPRLPPDTPLENVIAAFNGLVERGDGFIRQQDDTRDGAVPQGSREWILRLDGNELTLTDPPAVLKAVASTNADRALLIDAATRMIQIAAGIPATGHVDEASMRYAADVSALARGWLTEAAMDAVPTYDGGRRGSD